MEKIGFVRLRTGNSAPHCRQGKVQRVKRRGLDAALASEQTL